MGEGVVSVINGIAAGVRNIIAELVPYGLTLAGILLVLSVLFLGRSFMSGSTHFVGPALRFTGISTGVLWALNTWGWLVDLSRDTAHGALRAIGIDGFGAMFQLAQVSSQRIINEMVGFSATAPISSIADSLIASLCAFFVLVGLSAPPLVAALAEIELLIGSAIAPLVLPALAVGWLRPIGFGVIQWQVSAVLRIVALGIISNLLANEITRVTELPTMTEAYQFAAIQQLVVVSLFAVMASFSASALANAIVRGSPGVLGGSTVNNVTSFAAGSLSSSARAGGSVGGGSVGAGGGGSGIGGGTRQAANNGGQVQTASKGSAFG